MMKKQLILLFTFITFSTLLFAGPKEAAMGVLERRIPQLENRVSFIEIPQISEKDIFETEARNGHLTVKGTTAVAMCRGLYEYLKESCNCLITWEGTQLSIPNVLPDQALRRVEASVPLRQHFNVVTFGYTTSFWNWERWEFEIDWMALHGINMPLAMTGQEKIWQKIWKESYGLTDHDLNDYFTGPAFLAWNRMGDIYGNNDQVLNMLGNSPSGHSLPQSFIDRDAEMQRKILTREVELGMKPVIPGFSGFIPRALKTKYPSLNTWTPTPWNFACRSSLALHGLDPVFQEITNKYIDAYRAFYGDVSNYFLIDLFNEIDPPKTITQKDLANIAEEVYKSLSKKVPNATWVIQGWCFFYQAYWQNTQNTASFLSKVPNDKMIIIDLNADASEVFRLHPNSVAQKPVIWSLLNNNWGQRTRLHGDLNKIATKPIKALKDLGSHLVGMGNSSEGIENNSVCFELLYDNAWRNTEVNMNDWLKRYAEQRYGTKDPQAFRIWSKIYNLYYQSNEGDPTLPYQSSPSVKIAQQTFPKKEEKELIEMMLAAPQKIRSNKLYQRDLVDVVKSYVGNNIGTSIWKVVTSIQNNDRNSTKYREEFNQLMLGLDALLYTQKQHRLSKWIADARNYVDQENKNYLEKNARLILTTWVAPSWQGYARREWSGLVGDFYRNRWNRFFDALSQKGFEQSTFSKEIFEWSNAWCSNTTLQPSSKCDPVRQSKKMIKLIDQLYSNMPMVPIKK